MYLPLPGSSGESNSFSLKYFFFCKLKPKPTAETAEQKLRRQFDSIKAENKPDQVKTLTKFGLTKKEIRGLRYEKNRVEKILELMDK